MPETAPRLSVVVPGYNEVDSIGPLTAEVRGVMEATGQTWELVFVDDGSTDATLERMRAEAAADARIRVVKLARNFGKSAAYMAAFDNLRGETVITLDADLQDDPNEIPKLLAHLEAGRWDLVVGHKLGRAGNEAHKALPSRVYNAMNARLFGLDLHDANCGFRVMRRSVVRSLDLYGDQYRFIPQFTHVKGFRVTELGVNHRKRKFGISKYGPTRFWTGLLDLITVRFLTAFADRPMHFFGTAGLFLALPGGALLLYALIAKLGGDTFQEHIAAILIGVLLIVMGTQTALTGLLAELMSNQPGRPRYVIDPGDGR
jgi:glycosyltransferase involved in cell wall biosynthesis